jgi:hypothetical protein
MRRESRSSEDLLGRYERYLGAGWLDAFASGAIDGKVPFAAATGAPHNWDEAWAYYYGEKPGCAPHATAEERGKEFGTGSAVNQAILAAMKRGLAALEAKDAAGAAEARGEVVRQITITYLRSSLKHAAQIDADLAGGKAADARIWQAEGWA